MACRLFVAHEHETELRVLVNGVVHGQNGAARNTEHDFDTQVFQRATSACAPVIFSPSTMVRLCVCWLAFALATPLNACRGVGDTVPSFVRCLVFKASAAGAIRVPRRALR